MKLAIFDLDGTLLPVDAGVEWVNFLAWAAGRDLSREVKKAQAFLADYKAGCFDVKAFMDFHARLLADFERGELELLRARFMQEVIEPKVKPSALALVAAMKADGYTTVMLTGTQYFVSSAIGKRFRIETVIATKPVADARGQFTGAIEGGLCYGPHKVARLKDFLLKIGEKVESLQALTCFTDSISDLPLLEFASTHRGQVVATNPDPRLKEEAEKRGWSIIELFAR